MMRNEGRETGRGSGPGNLQHAAEYTRVAGSREEGRGSGLQSRQGARGRGGTWSVQRIQIPPVADFPGNQVLPGHSLDDAAQIRRQEVMNRPVPAAHAGADGLLLDVLGESRTLLGELGMRRGGDVAHRIKEALITFEEHLFGVFTEETA